MRYAFRLPTNKILAQMAEPHVYHPPGRPPKEPRTWTTELRYRAATWQEPRRVILVVCERPGELYLDSFFIVTSFTKEELCSDAVVDYYRDRGAMEGHIGEHQSVVNGRLSSTNRPKSHIKHYPIQERATPVDAERVNAANLALHGIAFNLLTHSDWPMHVGESQAKSMSRRACIWAVLAASSWRWLVASSCRPGGRPWW